MKGLRLRLLLISLAGIVPVLLVLFLAFYLEREQLAQRAQREALRLAGLIAQQQEQHVESARRLLQTLALVPAIRDGAAGECSRVLAILDREIQGYSRFGLLRPDGHVYCTGGPLPEDTDRSERPFFKSVMASRAFSLGVYRVGTLGGIPILTVASPILDAQGEVANVIAVGLTIDWFGELLSRAELPEGAIALLFDQQGTVLARHPDHRQWAGRSFAGTELFRYIRAHRRGTARLRHVDGVERFTGFTPVSAALDNLYVSAGFSAAGLFGQTAAALLKDPLLTIAALFGTLLVLLLGHYTLVYRYLDRREQELVEKNQALAAANAELEQFVYVASHDLRAPLRGIDNLAKWIEQDLDAVLEGETRENMELLRGRILRLETLLDDILQYSRAGRLGVQVERVDSRALVGEIVALLDPPAGISVHAAADLPAFDTARGPLEQVLRNLINNAIKHHDRRQGRIEVTARDQGDFYEFAVADDGPGIAPEFHERIFRMFQTLRSRDEVEGSGMGLAIIRKLVRQQGGETWMESNPPARGTVFRFQWRKQWPLKAAA